MPRRRHGCRVCLQAAVEPDLCGAVRTVLVMLQAGAFATILNERGEVLLCHRPDVDLWNAPGGRVEDRESPWEAGVREIREETGVEAEVIRLASVSWKPDQTEILFQFVCRIVAGQLSLSDECDAFAYFPLERLPGPLGPAFPFATVAVVSEP
jgi:ADP-ribose pyrophosphatase YjhB (NUDIX family)